MLYENIKINQIYLGPIHEKHKKRSRKQRQIQKSILKMFKKNLNIQIQTSTGIFSISFIFLSIHRLAYSFSSLQFLTLNDDAKKDGMNISDVKRRKQKS